MMVVVMLTCWSPSTNSCPPRGRQAPTHHQHRRAPGLYTERLLLLLLLHLHLVDGKAMGLGGEKKRRGDLMPRSAAPSSPSRLSRPLPACEEEASRFLLCRETARGGNRVPTGRNPNNRGWNGTRSFQWPGTDFPVPDSVCLAKKKKKKKTLRGGAPCPQGRFAPWDLERSQSGAGRAAGSAGGPQRSARPAGGPAAGLPARRPGGARTPGSPG